MQNEVVQFIGLHQLARIGGRSQYALREIVCSAVLVGDLPFADAVR